MKTWTVFYLALFPVVLFLFFFWILLSRFIPFNGLYEHKCIDDVSYKAHMDAFYSFTFSVAKTNAVKLIAIESSKL